MTTPHPLPSVHVPDLIDRMEERPRAVWLAAVACTLIGVIGFILGLLDEPARAWTALTWNWTFWSGLSVGGAVVVAAATAANGQWIRPLRRFAEGLTAFLPVSYLLMILLFFGLGHVYHWVHEPPPVKAAWLNPSFFIVRQAVLVAIVYGFALALVYWSLRPDLGRMGERVSGWRASLYGRLTANWRGLDEEIERSRLNRERLAPAMAVVYALLWTVWAWDWIMSIDPHWFSTLFGAWMFMTYFLGALGATALLACRLRPYRRFADAVTPRTLHDIGKMLFAFTVFWTYLFFAQYLVIWYGRLPEETHFITQRLDEAYRPVAIVVILAVFFVPFVGLLGARPKRTPVTLTTFATISLFGLWLFHFLLLGPGVFPAKIALGPIELAIALGCFGLFALCYLTFLRVFPAIALAAGLPPDPQSDTLAAMTEPQHH